MGRRIRLLAVVVVVALALPANALAAPTFSAGASGVGDPYYPLDGNGGYDVGHYQLDVRYDPSTRVLNGKATIAAKATQNLSKFDLDFVGLTVRSITVNGAAAKWQRKKQELVITPASGLLNGSSFTTVVTYDGIPRALEEFGLSGFIATDDGALVAGEPHVAATWYPVNDHPSDKASYSIRVTVPAGLQAVSNGVLVSQITSGGRTTWRWDEADPMASYLVTAMIGQFDIHAYTTGGIRFWDAIDPVLFAPAALPHSGTQLAISQQADNSYKRLMRTIAVPAGGTSLSFWVTRDTEFPWDFFFVEAHTVGSDAWTTLPDVNGHSSTDTGASCPDSWGGLHTFLAHYQTNNGDGTCSPTGTTGSWNAATGKSDGYEQWQVNLSAYAGKTVEISLSYASDYVVQRAGVFIDDVVSSTGVGSTSFEADGNVLDGWTVPGAPTGSPGNDNDWIAGTVAAEPPPLGSVAQAAFARQREILSFESKRFGNYPFPTAGGIVDSLPGLGFALENQTRPVYSEVFFTDPVSAQFVVVHELAHQWYGDNVAVRNWRDIWLNEGFATYAEWLWSEDKGFGSAQDNFDFLYEAIPADDGFWSVVVADPGPDFLFDFAEYGRGAMTLHQLRLAVGDATFFRILKTWHAQHAGGNGSTEQFIALAEALSGQDLTSLFDTWLYTPSKPVLSGAAALPRSAARVDLRDAPSAIRSLVIRYDRNGAIGKRSH
jgi:peptidase M1-like protein/immune inhibitor InhA-like protein